MHVLDDQGRLRWASASITNVWKVAAGDVLGLGTSQVVAVSGGRGVHIFNGADGSGYQVVGPPPHYAKSVDFGGSVHKAAVAPSRRWLAFGTYEGDVVGWAVDPPLLLVATGNALNAFRVGAN